MVARLVRDQKVAGSNPVTSTSKRRFESIQTVAFFCTYGPGSTVNHWTLMQMHIILILACVTKIHEYAISGGAVPFLHHKARLNAAKPSDLFLELTQNQLELADCPA